MEKFKPHKGCDCFACKAGKRTKGGKAELHQNELKMRRKTKRKLKTDPEDFSSGPQSNGYLD